MSIMVAMIASTALWLQVPPPPYQPGFSRPPPPCDLAGEVVRRQDRLPKAAIAALPFRMVDPGQPFEDSDDVGPPPLLPFHRMICAKRIGDDYLIRFEHGGRGYSVASIVVRRVPGGYSTR